jgi:hypothetical protein
MAVFFGNENCPDNKVSTNDLCSDVKSNDMFSETSFPSIPEEWSLCKISSDNTVDEGI